MEAETQQLVTKSELETRLDEYVDRLNALEPRPIAHFVPTNGQEQQELFLSDQIENPQHTYGKLENFDFIEKIKSLDSLRADVENDPVLGAIVKQAMLDKIDFNKKTVEFMRLSNELKHAVDPAVKADIKAQLERQNKDIWGETDSDTYYGLLNEEFHKLDEAHYSAEGERLLAELKGMVSPNGASRERFVPSEETVASLQGALNQLYGGLLNHIPSDKESYDSTEIMAVFDTILREEFGQAAAGWRVIMDDSTSINVVAADKLIKVPRNRKPVSNAVLRGGVSCMKSVSI